MANLARASKESFMRGTDGDLTRMQPKFELKSAQRKDGCLCPQGLQARPSGCRSGRQHKPGGKVWQLSVLQVKFFARGQLGEPHFQSGVIVKWLQARHLHSVCRHFTLFLFGILLASEEGTEEKPMRKLVLLGILGCLLSPSLAQAQNEQNGQNNQNGQIGARDMAGAGLAGAILLGLAGYLALRRKYRPN